MRALLAALAVFAVIFFAGCVLPGAPPTSAPSVPSPPSAPSKTYVPPYAEPPAKPQADIPLRITFIDVGYGDAAIIQSDGKAMLFDAGPADSAPAVESALAKNKVEKIDILALSSNAPEHAGGASKISTDYQIAGVWTNGVDYNDADYDALLGKLSWANVSSVEYGDNFTLGRAKITILNPQHDRYKTSSSPDSIVMKVEYGSFCALLFSDSQAGSAAGSDMGTVMGGIDSKIASGSVPIACQVIKVGHHGSGTSASFQLLEKAKPSAAIISAGPTKDGIFPEPALLERLGLKGVSVYRTDTMGTVTLTSNGTDYSISTERQG